MGLENSVQLIRTVRAKRPLVHHITNYVTVNDCANACICCGGSPVMADAKEEMEEMASIASALVLNIGTLNSRTLESMEIAGRAANKAGTPVLLDPVGVGATKLRTEAVRRLLDRVEVSVLKGNQGEIGVLSGTGGDVKGVDSGGASDPASAVEKLSEKLGCVVAATGENDYVSSNGRTLELSNGHPLLGCVSGTGCMLSSVTGAYRGANGPSIDSVSTAISVFNLSAEYAAERSEGPGTFKPALMDALHLFHEESISRARIQEI